MEDLITLVSHYISETHLPKNVDCSYHYNHSLNEIAHMINSLSDYKVPINTLKEETSSKYVGEFNPYIKGCYMGLSMGINETYKKILDETN